MVVSVSYVMYVLSVMVCDVVVLRSVLCCVWFVVCYVMLCDVMVVVCYCLVCGVLWFGC